MEQQNLFKIRDLRKKDQFKIDDAYLNGYARICKPVATAVYTSLCRHAEFNSQKAFPSQELMALQHSIPIRAVRRGIKKLIEHNIVMVERERRGGKFINYIYTLLDKSEWKKIDHGAKTTYGEPGDDSAIWQKTTMVKRPTKDNKVIKDNKDNNKDNKDIAPASGAEAIPDLLKDKQKHIRIIGLWARAKKITFTSKDHQKIYIRRNLRAARDLAPYETKRIIEVMAYLIKNADFKATLETVGKFIDEDLSKLKIKKSDGMKYGRLHDGIKVVRKFGRWMLVNQPTIEADTEYYPEIARDEIMSEEEWQEKNKK